MSDVYQVLKSKDTFFFKIMFVSVIIYNLSELFKNSYLKDIKKNFIF